MIIAYKGYEPDLSCRGFKYELGETFVLSEKEMPPHLCMNGFHACIFPIHAFYYYPNNLVRSNRGRSVYTKVYLDKLCDNVFTDIFYSDSKVCGAVIQIDETLLSPFHMIVESVKVLNMMMRIANYPTREILLLNERARSCRSIHFIDDIRTMWTEIISVLRSRGMTAKDILKEIEKEQMKGDIKL